MNEYVSMILRYGDGKTMNLRSTNEEPYTELHRVGYNNISGRLEYTTKEPEGLVLQNFKYLDEFEPELLKFHKTIQLMENLLTSAEETFGENSMDIVFLPAYSHYNKYEFELTIKMGDIEMKNDVGHYMMLKGIVVKLRFVLSKLTGGIKIYQVTAFRETMDALQAREGFIWSHSQRTSKYSDNTGVSGLHFSRCCLGTSPLSTYVYRQRAYTAFDSDEMMYLLQNYFAWESIDGGPYMSMKQFIGTKTGEHVDIIPFVEFTNEQLIDMIRTEGIELGCDVELFITRESITDMLNSRDDQRWCERHRMKDSDEFYDEIDVETERVNTGLPFRDGFLTFKVDRMDRDYYGDMRAKIFVEPDPRAIRSVVGKLEDIVQDLYKENTVIIRDHSHTVVPDADVKIIQ